MAAGNRPAPKHRRRDSLRNFLRGERDDLIRASNACSGGSRLLYRRVLRLRSRHRNGNDALSRPPPPRQPRLRQRHLWRSPVRTQLQVKRRYRKLLPRRQQRVVSRRSRHQRKRYQSCRRASPLFCERRNWPQRPSESKWHLSILVAFSSKRTHTSSCDQRRT